MSIKLPDARKKRSKALLKNPLPVPLSSDANKKSQSFNQQILFHGIFKYGAVIIEDSKFADILWENGYFGDGNLSSSGLRYKSNLQGKTEEIKHGICREKELPSGSLSVSQASKNIVPEKAFQHDSTEVLHLCLEEAFFLSYALGTLILCDEAGCQMDIDAMWNAFQKIYHQFPLQYAVYHHFRCKGWVVKQGKKFGADWVLYPVGPPFYHSQYLVWVQCLWKENLTEDLTLSTRRSNIEELSALERLSGHVGKAVLLCQVLRPSTVTRDILGSVECLRHFIISEIILQRWTPNMELSAKMSSVSSSSTAAQGEKRASDAAP